MCAEIREASGGYDDDVAVVSDDFFDGVRDRVEGAGLAVRRGFE